MVTIELKQSTVDRWIQMWRNYDDSNLYDIVEELMEALGEDIEPE